METRRKEYFLKIKVEFDVGLSCCRDDTTRSRELPVGEQCAGHGCDRLCRAGTGREVVKNCTRHRVHLCLDTPKERQKYGG